MTETTPVMAHLRRTLAMMSVTQVAEFSAAGCQTDSRSRRNLAYLLYVPLQQLGFWFAVFFVIEMIVLSFVAHSAACHF